MTLNATSLKWAIDSVTRQSDGDLFPKPLELDAISAMTSDLINRLLSIQLRELQPGPHRRFIIPKDEVSYRQSTQLDPQDSILLTALIYQFGQGIENRRLPTDTVFSYRFAPSKKHGLYASRSSWNDFWARAKALASQSPFVLHCDIADFYNQISHHTVDNQLIASYFPNQAKKWIVRLLKSTTAGVSRGIPIGPHPMHLIAEATLIPIDNAIRTRGFQFLRYVDDILIFCDSRQSAQSALGMLAKTLDRQQRMILQHHKTRILNSVECSDLADKMIEDRPINSDEIELLSIVRKYSKGNPYMSISYEMMKPKDWAVLTEEKIAGIIDEYLNQPTIDFVRLRWFYRRLAQIGHPSAMRVTLERIDDLRACFPNVCSYFASIQSVDDETWADIGRALLELLEEEYVKESEFFRLSILSLFSRNVSLNHFSRLVSKFSSSDSSARREILLAAHINNAIDWVREQKETYNSMDPWQRRALMYCCSKLPSDERRYFLHRHKSNRPFDDVLSKWARNS